MAEINLDALMEVAERLPELVQVLTDKLVLDVQTVAIAEAEGDLEGAWAIALPWMTAIAKVRHSDGSGAGGSMGE